MTDHNEIKEFSIAEMPVYDCSTRYTTGTYIVQGQISKVKVEAVEAILKTY